MLEQTLGHVTHSANLRALLSDDPRIEAVWSSVEYDRPQALLGLPGLRNWTLRAGLQARRAVAAMLEAGPLDVLFFHTQVPAMLAGRSLQRVPAVISVDATPRQYDELGRFYHHRQAPAAVESAKWALHRRRFQAAAHLVSWSAWAKQGLVDGYGIAPDRISVVPPGVRTSTWRPTGGSCDGVVRILFVGGDLERKGGSLLLQAFAALRQTDGPPVELHLVTHSPVERMPGVVVHAGLAPNSEALKRVYWQSDIFCLPTQGDCLPMVLAEAGAAELPLVSTEVGAVPEVVRDGDTGLVVPVDDPRALARALRRLVDDPALRRRLGQQAASLVRAEHDAAANADRLVRILQSVAASNAAPARSRSGGGRPAVRRHPGSEGRVPTRAPGPRVLLTVSGAIPADVAEEVDRGVRPRPDYLVMAEEYGADLVDVGTARAGGWMRTLVGRLLGPFVLLAWEAFRRRDGYDVVFTDGEQVGLPYAALCRLRGGRRPRHVMIVHIMSRSKKSLLFRGLDLGRCIDTMFVYATAQQQYLQRRLGTPPDRVVLTPFMVDTRFFAPATSQPRSMICSAGLEWRDYPTLIAAVRGLDVEVVLAAASPWSKRNDTSERVPLPDNVRVCQLGFRDLRALYADSLFVVVPLEDVAFQAGVTTILEAMAMGKAVICTRTTGQTDIVVEGETGLYVPPADPVALRQAITWLLEHPEQAQRMGAAGRRLAETRMDVVAYARRLGAALRADADGGRE